MIDIIVKVLHEPLFACLGVIAVWALLYLLLIKVLNLKASTWIKLEYVWIGVGFLGVLILVDENRRQTKTSELEQVAYWIDSDYKSLISFTKYQFHCIKYIITGIFSEEEFNLRQAESDEVCEWITEVACTRFALHEWYHGNK